MKEQIELTKDQIKRGRKDEQVVSNDYNNFEKELKQFATELKSRKQKRIARAEGGFHELSVYNKFMEIYKVIQDKEVEKRDEQQRDNEIITMIQTDERRKTIQKEREDELLVKKQLEEYEEQFREFQNRTSVKSIENLCSYHKTLTETREQMHALVETLEKEYTEKKADKALIHRGLVTIQQTAKLRAPRPLATSKEAELKVEERIQEEKASQQKICSRIERSNQTIVSSANSIMRMLHQLDFVPANKEDARKHELDEGIF